MKSSNKVLVDKAVRALIDDTTGDLRYCFPLLGNPDRDRGKQWVVHNGVVRYLRPHKVNGLVLGQTIEDVIRPDYINSFCSGPTALGRYTYKTGRLKLLATKGPHNGGIVLDSLGAHGKWHRLEVNAWNSCHYIGEHITEPVKEALIEHARNTRTLTKLKGMLRPSSCWGFNSAAPFDPSIMRSWEVADLRARNLLPADGPDFVLNAYDNDWLSSDVARLCRLVLELKPVGAASLGDLKKGIVDVSKLVSGRTTEQVVDDIAVVSSDMPDYCLVLLFSARLRAARPSRAWGINWYQEPEQETETEENEDAESDSLS